MSKDIEPSAPVAMGNPDLKIIFDPEWNMVGTNGAVAALLELSVLNDAITLMERYSMVYVCMYNYYSVISHHITSVF